MRLRSCNRFLNQILIVSPFMHTDCAGSCTKSIMMKPIYQAAQNQFSSERFSQFLLPIMKCLGDRLNKGWRKFVANENPLKNFPKWLSWVYALPSLYLSFCVCLSLPHVLPLFHSFMLLEMRRRRHRFFHVRPATDSRFASNSELRLELKSKFSAEHLSAADLISVTRRLGRYWTRNLSCPHATSAGLQLQQQQYQQ